MATIPILTGGPSSMVTSLYNPANGTFEGLRQRIADEIDDVHGEYGAQIQAAIFAAIRYCEREPFYFNESRDVVFETVKSQEFYDRLSHRQIADLGGMQAVYCERADGTRWLLRAKSQDAMEILNDRMGSEGEPVAYVYFAQKLRFYPVPDGIYTIRLRISPMRLDEIDTINDTSPWFVEAFDLIRARAKYEIYKDILKDEIQAVASLNDFNDQLQALRVETSRRSGTGKIIATHF